MKLDRRELLKAWAAGAALFRGRRAAKIPGGALSPSAKSYDVAVIGAGVFGAWTAYRLRQKGMHALLLDASGPANSRASSGGESRIIRMGYGADEIYTRSAMRSLPEWQELFRRTGCQLFHRTGVLWLGEENDPYMLATEKTLARVGAQYEKLSRADLEKRYPQIALGKVSWALLEPGSGALMARRAVQAVVAEAERSGVNYRLGRVESPSAPHQDRLAAVTTSTGESFSAGSFVFACGPWLGKVFPGLLADRIFPTRQEVFFIGVPAGDSRFAPPAMPIWIHLADEIYGFPDLENRGFKIASDLHGAAFDPDTGERIATQEGLAVVRQYLARHFPALAAAPVLEARVCQYENTSNGDFLIDRHPDFENVWLVGGGSGHGFKHGPAVGDYVAARMFDAGPAEPRFSLASKAAVQHRAVY